MDINIHDEPLDDNVDEEKDSQLLKEFGGPVDIEEAGPLDVPDVDDPDHEGPLDIENDDRTFEELQHDSQPADTNPAEGKT